MNDYRAALDNAMRAVKIEFSPAEKERLLEEMAAFQQWLEPLLAVDTAGNEPLLFSHRGVNVIKEGRPEAGDPERLQNAAANFDEGFYRVPSIIESDS